MPEPLEPKVPQPQIHAANFREPENPDVELLPVASESSSARRPISSNIFLGSDGLRAGWSLLIYMALFVAMVSGARAVIRTIHLHSHHAQAVGPSQFKPSDVLLIEGSLAAAVMLLTWIMSRIERKPVSAYGLAPVRWLPRLLAGIAWGVGFLSLLVFSLRAAGLLIFDGRLLAVSVALRSGLLWFASFLAVGFFEEIFFRGYMQSTLARGFSGIYGWFGAPNRQALGFWTSAVLLSFGFGFIHKSNPGESPIGLLSAGLIGVVFCLSLWRTGSLWWAIGLHAAWDWAQSFLYGVADSGTVIVGRLYATHPAGKPILSGGLTGPEGSIFILPIVLLISAVVVLTLPPTRTPPYPTDTLSNPTALDLA